MEQRKQIRLLQFILFFSIILQSCETKEKKETKKLEINQNWISDSLGCLNKRNENLAKKMILKYKLERSSKEKFINFFGKPNDVEKDGNVLILVYYLQTICTNNSINDSSDKCYARFYFGKNRLIDQDYICE